jgi:hypothetical protein
MIKFHLDQKAGIPFYRQIIDQIRFGIATGTLAVGEQLPLLPKLTKSWRSRIFWRRNKEPEHLSIPVPIRFLKMKENRNCAE